MKALLSSPFIARLRSLICGLRIAGGPLRASGPNGLERPSIRAGPFLGQAPHTMFAPRRTLAGLEESAPSNLRPL